MYIQPNTIIKLLKNVPLDTSYEHTIFFTSLADQLNYFNSLVKTGCTFNKNTYQRAGRGKIRVNANAETLYDCNYLMFQNERFGAGKWFFAFIKEVEYVNELVSEISYELDVMQSWLFDASGNYCYSLADSFVERNHSITDTPGDNLIEEGLELGDYLINSMDTPSGISEMKICIAAPLDDSYQIVAGDRFGGLPSATQFKTFPNTSAGAAAAAQWIINAGTKQDKIVSMFLIPTCLIDVDANGFVTNLNAKSSSFSMVRPSALGSYTPINKKLLTYPYNMIYLTNLQGQSNFYRYEYFSNPAACVFNYSGTVQVSPEIVCSPMAYKGTQYANYDEKLTLSGFPQLNFNTDPFKQQLGTSLITHAITGLAGTASGVATSSIASKASEAAGAVSKGAGITAGYGIFNTVMSIVSQLAPSAIAPVEQKGNATGGSTLAAVGILNIMYANKSIRPEYAKIIDNYFSLFGYAQRRVMKPYRCSRNYWTFLKTVGCDIHGSVPSDDAEMICKIYDKGITLWRYASGRTMQVGEYTQLASQNTILSAPIH